MKRDPSIHITLETFKDILEELEIIKDYERKASKNENSNSDDINFLEFLKTSKEL